MPAFPTYERSQGLSGGATASYASSSAFTAPARAMEGLGNAIENVGGVFEQRAQKFQQSQDDVWFSKARAETAMEAYKAQEELKLSATDKAENYTPQVQGRFQQIQEARVANAPSPRARQMYEEWAFTYNADLTNNAARFQAESALAKRTDDFAQTMLTHSQMVLADPKQYDAVAKRAMDDLAGAAQWMTPEQEVAARRSVEEQLQVARAQGEIQRDPQAFLESIGVSQKPEGKAAYREAIASIESKGSGDYAAVGPTHSTLGRALGRYQIMEANIGPWSRKHLGRTVSAEEFMANPDIQDAIFDGEFGTYVAKYGLEGAAQAWFAGEGGVGKVDRKDSLGTDVGSYGKKFVAALGGQTASGPNVAGDPRFSSLTPDQILGLTQQATTRSNQLQADILARDKAMAAEQVASLEQGIILGDSSVTAQAILSAGLATDDENKLLNQLETKGKDRRMAQDAMTRMDIGGSFDRFDSEDRKAVGLAYDQVTGGQSLFGQQSNAQAVLQMMYDRSGIVPQTAKNEIRAGLLSQDPKQVAAAASVANRLYASDPGALGSNENGEELVKAATTYRHMTETLGLTNDQAGQRMVDMADPEKLRQRQALLETKPVKDGLKKVSAGDVQDIFDPGLFGFDPRAGDTPAAEAAMVADYRSMLEESIVESAGDMGLAEQLAADRFKRLYSPSTMTLAGDRIIVKYPPEVTYPPVNGSHAYVKDQALEALKMEGVEAEDVWLQPTPDTAADFNAGKSAQYLLYYRQGNRIEQYELPFFAEPEIARERENAKTRFEDNRAREMERFPDGRPDPTTERQQYFDQSQQDTGRLLRGDFDALPQ